MKFYKVLCYMFLLAILGVHPAQNLIKYKGWLCIVKHKTKAVQGQRPFNINLSLFVSFFDVYLAS